MISLVARISENIYLAGNGFDAQDEGFFICDAEAAYHPRIALSIIRPHFHHTAAASLNSKGLRKFAVFVPTCIKIHIRRLKKVYIMPLIRNPEDPRVRVNFEKKLFIPPIRGHGEWILI